MYAVFFLQRLLARGAALDVKCPAVRTYKSALCVACEVNSPEIIRLILDAGGDPSSRGHNSYTPTLVRGICGVELTTVGNGELEKQHATASRVFRLVLLLHADGVPAQSKVATSLFRSRCRGAEAEKMGADRWGEDFDLNFVQSLCFCIAFALEHFGGSL